MHCTGSANACAWADGTSRPGARRSWANIVQTRKMSPRLAFALETAQVAGDSTLKLFRDPESFSLKTNLTPVTEADVNAEQIVRKRINEAYPTELILGEEEGGDVNSLDRWIVDPIDGTKSFVCGVPLYATLLSYEVDREPIVGVAYFPALGHMVYAEKGSGTFCDGSRVQVSSNNELQRAVVCCGGHASMEKRGLGQGLLDLSMKVMSTRTWCDAYGHFLVATGRVDAMVDPIVSRWDISALALIVREAGGKFTDVHGQEDLTDNAISSTPQMLGSILGAFRE